MAPDLLEREGLTPPSDSPGNARSAPAEPDALLEYRCSDMLLATRSCHDGAQCLVDDADRLVDVGLRMRQRDVDLVDGLHEPAPQTFLVEVLDAHSIGGHRRAVIHDLAIGEDHVEDRRLAADLRGNSAAL